MLQLSEVLSRSATRHATRIYHVYITHRSTCGKKKNLVKYQNVSKYYENDCLQDFLLFFMSLLTAKFVKTSHIWAIIYFIFLKILLKQSWNFFNTIFQPH